MCAVIRPCVEDRAEHSSTLERAQAGHRLVYTSYLKTDCSFLQSNLRLLVAAAPETFVGKFLSLLNVQWALLTVVLTSFKGFGLQLFLSAWCKLCVVLSL